MNSKANIFKTTYFSVLSISFEKANAEIRGKFAFFDHQMEEFSQKIQQNQWGDAFVVSTCNRTEIYANTQHIDEIVQLYCETVGVDRIHFKKHVTQLAGENALNHLFRVAAGLESQILGDFEIIFQIKNAYKKFKEYKTFSNSYLERAINSAIQISKRIKHETGLSNGAASVSYAAVHYILHSQIHVSEKNILLVGTGEIGQNTIDNLVKHVKNPKIKIANRTNEKAEKISEKLEVAHLNFEKLEKELKKTDILIVATGAAQPIITPENFPKDKEMLVIDMSIPNNVEKSIAQYDKVELVDVDFLSQQIKKTIQQRKKEIPKAETIINEVTKDFFDWEYKRKFAPNIRYFKANLKNIEKNELHSIHKKFRYAKIEDMELSNKMVQKITNRFAKYIIDHPQDAEKISGLMEEIFVINPKK